jgi:hypothetical protein
MKLFFTLLLASILGLAFAVPAPQHIAIELGKAFSVKGSDTASFETMTFRLESVSVTGENPQVMVSVTTGENEEPDMLMLELPAAASVEVGDYTLTLLGATVPENSDMPCAVSTGTLVLEKTEAEL